MKLILSVVVGYLLYAQISHFKSEDWFAVHLEHVWALLVAVVLVVPNIWLAYAIWTEIISALSLKTDRSVRIQSFFAGIITGLLTPNMIGNFIGRFYYFEKKERSQITAFTMLSNFGQYLASMTFGTLAVFWVGELLVWRSAGDLIYMLLFIVIISYLIYFFIDNFMGRFRSAKFSSNFRAILKKNPWFRTRVLLLSFGRFAIFTTQFSLMLYAFGETWNWTLIAAIWQVYLLVMVAPSLFLGKVGVKESISLYVLTGLGLNPPTILLVSLLIWFLNTLSPALVGFVVCRKRENT